MNTFKPFLNTTIGMISNPKFTPLQQSKSSKHETKEIWMTFSTDISCTNPILSKWQECHELTKKRFGKTIQMFALVFKQ
jgi:hypothetical protein